MLPIFKYFVNSAVNFCYQSLRPELDDDIIQKNLERTSKYSDNDFLSKLSEQKIKDLCSSPRGFNSLFGTQKPIGKGVYGSVSLLEFDGTRFAVKKGDVRSDWKIARIWSKDPNTPQSLVKCFIHLMDTDKVYRVFDTEEPIVKPKDVVVMEYVDGNTLATLDLSLAQVLDLFQQVIVSIRYFEENRIIPGDLHAENMMVTKAGVLKFIDYGFYFRFSEQQRSFFYSRYVYRTFAIMDMIVSASIKDLDSEDPEFKVKNEILYQLTKDSSEGLSRTGFLEKMDELALRIREYQLAL